MSHVVDVAAVVEEELVQLVGDPEREHGDCRRPEEVEVDQHPVEEADPAHAVEHGEHGHDAGDGAGSANAGHGASGIDQQIEAGGADAREQVEGEKAALAQGFLDHVTDDEQEGHVAKQVVKAAVQEHVPDQPRQRRLCGNKTKTVDHPGTGERIETLPLSLPVGVNGLVRGDDLAAAQALHERLVVLHLHQHGQPLSAVQRLLRLRRIVRFAQRLEVGNVARQFDSGQRRRGVVIEGLGLALAVAALQPEVDQAVDEDE